MPSNDSESYNLSKKKIALKGVGIYLKKEVFKKDGKHFPVGDS
jgi:hypothetical protein